MSDLASRFKAMPPLFGPDLGPIPHSQLDFPHLVDIPFDEAMERAIAHLQAGEHVVVKFLSPGTRTRFRSSLFTRLVQLDAVIQWEEKIATCRAWNGTCALLTTRSPFWDVPVAHSYFVKS